MATKWKREDWVRIFEHLIDHNCAVTSSNRFRDHLNRDENLIANQITREANGNIAYRSVDFDLQGLSDEEIWARLDGSKHQEMIEDNAAAALMKMAEKFQLVE